MRVFSILIFFASLLVGCAEADFHTLAIRWQFPAGQLCRDTSVERVEVIVSQGSQTLTSFSCWEGESPHLADLGDFKTGVVLIDVEAFSKEEALLYEGHFRIELPMEEEVSTLPLETP